MRQFTIAAVAITALISAAPASAEAIFAVPRTSRMANAGSRNGTHPRVRPLGDIGDRARKKRPAPDVVGVGERLKRRRLAVGLDAGSSGLTSALGPAVLCG